MEQQAEAGQSQNSTPSTAPVKQKSAAGKIILTAFITSLFIGGSTFAIMFFFQNSQKSSLESSITSKEAEIESIKNDFEEVKAELDDTKAMLEEEKEKAEAVESNNQQTSALAPTLVSPPTYIVGAGIETTSYSTAGGTQFTQSELLPTLYPSSTAEEIETLHIDSFIQDGLNKDVIYVETTNFGSVESGAFTEFFRVDFSNAEPDAITLFKQDIELESEQAPEFGTRISFLGRDQGKLVFVTADVDDSPGPCANLWLDAEKAENSRTYSYIDLATVNENLDQEDLSDTLTFEAYAPSQAVIDEQTDIQEQCVIDLQNIQDAL